MSERLKMNKNTKQWLTILEFFIGIAGIILIWHETNFEIAFAISLLMFSQNLHNKLNK